jgi:hypothetical protein
MANFIKKAIKKPGALRAQAARAGESTREYAEAHKHDSGKTGQRSRLAITLMGMKKKNRTKSPKKKPGLSILD